MRFSLRWLFGIVAFTAVACASLLNATKLTSEALGAALGAFLIIATIGAVFCQGDRRAFWGGCAIAGWSYVVGMRLPTGVQLPHNVVDAGLRHLHDSVKREGVVKLVGSQVPDEAYVKSGVWYVPTPKFRTFAASGQALAAFVVAVIGGIAGRCFYTRQHCSKHLPKVSLT